jgi:hypothetical protein
VSAAGVVAVQPEPSTPESDKPKQEAPKQAAPAPAARPTPTPPPADDPIETELLLKDGRKVSGIQIEQSAEKIVLRIGGIDTTFRMDVVDKVQALPTVLQRYEALRASIDPEDVDGLMRLADWLRSHNRFDLALGEVDRALKVEPANPEAKALRTLIIEQEKIARERVAISNNKDHVPTPQALKTDFPLLTPEQINIIRVFELNVKDAPRMKIDRNTITRFMDKYAGRIVEGKGTMPTTPEGRAVFYAMKPADILDWMFSLKAREFYGEVQVLENPKALQNFRDHVNRMWLVNSCATSNCHGGPDAGRLWLYNKRSGSDQAAYTNFLILERFKLQNGMPIVNYTEPANSPLLQMGLPRDQAIIKHPEMTGVNKGKWRAVFRGQEDERFQQALDWIKSMYEKRADYPIDYKPPVPQPRVVSPAPIEAEPTAPAAPGER